MNNKKAIKELLDRKVILPNEVENKIYDSYSIIRKEGMAMKSKKSYKYRKIAVVAMVAVTFLLVSAVPVVRAGVLNILNMWSNESDRGIDNALNQGVYQNIEGISTSSNGAYIEVITVFADTNRIGITLKINLEENKNLVLDDGNNGGFDYSISDEQGELLYSFARVEDSPLKPFNPHRIRSSDKLYELDGQLYYNILLSATDSVFKDITGIQFDGQLLTLHEKSAFKSSFEKYEGQWNLEIPIEQNKEQYSYTANDLKDVVKINKAISTPFGFVIDYVVLNQGAENERLASGIQIIDEDGNEFVPRQGFGLTGTEEGARLMGFIESPYYNECKTLVLHCPNGDGDFYTVNLRRDD